MSLHPLAGKPAPVSMLVDVPRLLAAYTGEQPDVKIPQQRVSFGTSGHRGSSLKRSFNERHVLAVTQAVCEYRALQKTTGPLFLGLDTHALSRPAFETALEVLAANRTAASRRPRSSLMPF
jgi:phosphoglucomutase